MKMTEREVRIDVLRGMAMVSILIDHMTMKIRSTYAYHGLTIPTLTHFGYSSAASLFVALSGYMVGMVYLKRKNPISSVLRRALHLYIINFFVLVLLVIFAYSAPEKIDQYWNLRPIIDPPYEQLLKFFFLLDAPAFTDVLQLYVALLLVSPLAILLIRRSPMLLAGCSIGLWAVVQIAGLIYGPDGVLLSNGHSLNVLAWQLTFFLPMIAGNVKLHERVFAWFENQPKALPAIWIVLILTAVAHEIHAERILPATISMVNRPLNAPVWLGHSLLVLAGYAGLLVWLKDWLKLWPFQLLASIGRSSLNVFVASTPLIYLFALCFGWLDWGWVGYLLCVFALLGCSLVIAAWGDRRKARKSAARSSADLGVASSGRDVTRSDNEALRSLREVP